MRFSPSLSFHSIIACTSLAVTGACGQLPIEYETDYFRVGTALDYPLCAGNLAALDRKIQAIDDDLGLRPRQVVDLYIWDDASWRGGARDQHCRGLQDGVSGCFSASSGTIWAVTTSVDHEIGHAATHVRGAEPLFSEGVAELHGGDVLVFGRSLPTENIEIAVQDLDVATAGHFVRWLHEMWGGKKLGAVMARGGKVEDFEAVYGMSLEAAQSEWLADAPAAYAPMRACDAPDLTAAPLFSVWHERIDLDCDDPAVFAGPGGLFVRRSVTIEHEGRYAIAIESGWFDVFRCTEGRAFTRPVLGDPNPSDVPADVDGSIDPAFRHFAGGVIHELDLVRGNYEFRVGVDGHAPNSTALTVWPALGPFPAEPGP